jgi:DHA1 family bicyclomycin/chloramphenicol resistance-like MFS transporter
LAVLPGLAHGILISYVAGSAFVFKQGYNLSTAQFVLLLAANGIAMIIGAQLCATLVKRYSPALVLRTSVPLTVLWTGTFFLVSVSGTGGLPLLLASLSVVVFFSQFSQPNATTLALARHGDRAGTAAAFIGSLQAGLAGLISPLVGFLGASAPAMSAVMLGTALIALLVLALGTPIYHRGGASRLDQAQP